MGHQQRPLPNDCGRERSVQRARSTILPGYSTVTTQTVHNHPGKLVGWENLAKFPVHRETATAKSAPTAVVNGTDRMSTRNRHSGDTVTPEHRERHSRYTSLGLETNLTVAPIIWDRQLHHEPSRRTSFRASKIGRAGAAGMFCFLNTPTHSTDTDPSQLLLHLPSIVGRRSHSHILSLVGETRVSSQLLYSLPHPSIHIIITYSSMHMSSLYIYILLLYLLLLHTYIYTMYTTHGAA